MKSFNTVFVTLLFIAFASCKSFGQGFTEPEVTFYGEVRKTGGGQTVLLQSGKLEMILVNQTNPTNRVALKTDLYPVGSGTTKPYSYALKVPIAYLPEAPRMSSYLSVTTQPISFKIEEINIDGTPATLPDGSKEFYNLSFASRSGEYRLDLAVTGDSVSSAHDGIPDWWKRIHGLDTTIDVSGDDPDADGWTNIDEFRRGGNPNVSNLDPQLLSTTLNVPTLGHAGLYLHFLDADTPDSGISILLPNLDGSGFQACVDGVPIASDTTGEFSMADLKAGRLTIKHINRNISHIAFPLSWSDGGEIFSYDLLVRATVPTIEDGSDAALWLDGTDLPQIGTPIGVWYDRSGNQRHAMQPAAEFQPVAGDRTVDFSNSKNAHFFFHDSALPPNDQTIFACYRTPTSSDMTQTLLSTNRGFIDIAATNQPVSYPGAPTFQVDGVAARSFRSAAGMLTTSIFRRHGDIAQNIFDVSYSGESVSVTEIEPVLPALGARRSAISEPGQIVDTAFDGQLNELLIFPTALPEQKLRNIHNYLASKWGDAVIWDFSTQIRPITLTASVDMRTRIIRGGFSDDRLNGGAGSDIISGGAGQDVLSGGGGSDRFLFGLVDTGRKIITDFNITEDILDLSSIYWGVTGDARQYLSVRLETDYSTPVPTLDSVLILNMPSGGTQEIVLKGVVIGSAQLVQSIVEGRIAMGALSIPTTVQVALTSSGNPIAESMVQSFTVNMTRSGPGASAALDIPIGFFNNAPGGHFVVDGALMYGGRRAVLNFPRGVTNRTFNLYAVPDLESGGAANVQIAVLPRYEYSVSGNPVNQAISDIPKVWLEVIQPNSVASPAQPARIVLHREGNLGQSLVVDFQLGGTAVNGQHVQTIPTSATIFAGQKSREIAIHANAQALLSGPKTLLLRISTRDRYLAGSPHEGLIYVGNTHQDVAGAGFDKWLQTVSGARITGLDHLLQAHADDFGAYLLAYGLGSDAADNLFANAVKLRIVNDRPELLLPGRLTAADLRWNIETSNDLKHWADVGGSFVEVLDGSGTKFIGPKIGLDDHNRLYRLKLLLDPGQSLLSGISAIARSNMYGTSGAANWIVDGATGDLICMGGVSGETSRIIARTNGPALLDFEMSIIDGDWNDALVFYIDGVRQSGTFGDKVRIQRTLGEVTSHLLMWEFTKGSGRAVIRNLSR